MHPAALAVGAALVALPLFPPSPPGRVSPADVMLGGAVMVTMLWLGTNEIRVHLPYVIPWALYAGAGMLASALGAFPVHGAIAVVQDVVLLAWAAAVANTVRTSEALKTVLRAWVYGATAWAAMLVLAVVAQAWWPAGGADQITIGSWSFGIPSIEGNFFALSVFVMWLGDVPRSRIGRALVAVTLVAALAATGSSAALSALAIGGAAAAFVAIWRRSDLMTALGSIMFGLIPFAIVAVLVVETGALDRVRSSWNPLIVASVDRSAVNAAGGAAQWPQVFELYREGNPLGIGAAATIPSLGREGINAGSAHDDYLATVVERGPVGAMGLIILMAGLIVRAFTLAMGPISAAFERVVRNPPALVGGLVTVWTMGFTQEVLHAREVWAFLGLLAGLYLFARAPGRARSSTPVAAVR